MNDSTAWADEVLAVLRRGPGTIAQLAHDLSISAGALDAALEELRVRGYGIEPDESGALVLAEIPDLLLADEIEHATNGLRLGKPLYTYGRIGSTNTAAAELAAAGAAEGALVTAEEQVRGKGRQGRSWDSPPGVGIWMSLVLRPPLKPAQAAGLSLVGGLAVAAALSDRTGVEAMVKWPNDVYMLGKKVCGVLCESVLEGTRVRYTIMGIGINVNQTEEQIPKELRDSAASLRTVAGKMFRRVPILAAVLRELQGRYDRYCAHGFGALREEYRARSLLTGREVTVSQHEREIHGRAIDIAPDGSLLVESAARVEQIQVGEASLRID